MANWSSFLGSKPRPIELKLDPKKKEKKRNLSGGFSLAKNPSQFYATSEKEGGRKGERRTGEAINGNLRSNFSLSAREKCAKRRLLLQSEVKLRDWKLLLKLEKEN